MQASFDLYISGDTWLHRLDPRVKLLFVLDASLLVFLWPDIWAAAAVLALCMLIFWQARLPFRQIAHIWNMMGPLLLMVFALTALFSNGPGPAWFHAGPFTITAAGVQNGGMLALRLLALAVVILLWLYTTGQTDLVRGFLALRLPYEWGLTLALALRYLPTFAALFQQISEAQQARGLDLTQRKLWQRLAAYQPVLVAMMISALRQSERLGWALEARALGAQDVRRTTFRALHMQKGDYLVLILLAGVLAGEIILRTL